MLRSLLLALLLSVAPAATLAAEAGSSLVRGQTLYLPVYSFIWHGDIKDGTPDRTPVSTLVSIRNTDQSSGLRITSARFYDTSGRLLKEYMPKPVILPALGTHELYVERRDVSGGSGANFIIEWQSEKPINAPIVEAVHAEILGHKTLVFLTAGRVLRATD